jgi:hypothetical protein
VAAVIGIVLLAIAAVVGLRSRRALATPVGSTAESGAIPTPGTGTLEESKDVGDAV